jgi:hypothetical protein
VITSNCDGLQFFAARFKNAATVALQTCHMEPEFAAIIDAASKESTLFEQPVQGPVLQAADPEQHHQTCSKQLDTKRPADGNAEGADEHAKRSKVEQHVETLDVSDGKQDNSTGAGDSVSDDAGSDVDEQGVLQLS